MRSVSAIPFLSGAACGLALVILIYVAVMSAPMDADHGVPPPETAPAYGLTEGGAQ